MTTTLSFNNDEIQDKLISGFDATQQIIQNRLNMIRGTWAFDNIEGLDIPNNFYKDEEEVIADVVNIILSTDGVSQEEGAVQLVNKIKQKDGKLMLEFTIQTIYNRDVKISV